MAMPDSDCSVAAPAPDLFLLLPPLVGFGMCFSLFFRSLRLLVGALSHVPSSSLGAAGSITAVRHEEHDEDAALTPLLSSVDSASLRKLLLLLECGSLRP